MTTEKDKARVSDNELIAKWMGAQKGNGGTKNNPVYTGIIVSPSGVTWTSDLKSMRYHESFDWLMPVVEKINQVKPRHDFFMNLTIKNLTIDSLYKSVVEFIKWHNE